MDNVFRVGYCRMVLNPSEPIPLQGYSNEPKRFHTAITEDICATCVALSDGETTVLMVGTDTCTVLEPFASAGRKRICDVTGLPEDRVFIAATHSHSAPAFSKQQFPSVQRYMEEFIQGMEKAALAAIDDLKPARMYTGSIETENLNFIKHYKARNNETGAISYLGDGFGTVVGNTILDHATKIDPTMHMVRFTREGGKDVVMTNFRAHPHFTGGLQKYDLSSDYIGAYRMALEAMLDCHAVYFQGAGGNVNSSTRIPDERRYTTCRSYGLGLAAAAAECLAKYMTEVQPGSIKTKQLTVYGEINHTMDHLKEKAAEIRHIWDTTFDKPRCMEMARPYGIRSVYHAGAIKANATRTKEKDGWMILNAVSVGDEFAFVTFPGEMFDSISVRMEENSPFNTTMMLGYCYHHIGYLPSAVAYKYTSYETDITRFQAGTGEMVADTYVEMLKELKGENIL